MDLKNDRNCHAVYNLKYHLIFVTKYRKRCINEVVFHTLKAQLERIASMYNAAIEEIAYEPDHVHILLSAPPQVCLSQMINIMKTTSSRIARKEHAEYLKQYFWKPYFWSRSYMILSSGGAPIEVIRAYIKEQGTEKHAEKSAKRKAAIST